jgi:t-SNARE complex subunit (syntaxin)
LHKPQEQLTRTAGAVHSMERAMREIATLNQLFSAAVLSQAEAIETIYANAVDASLVSAAHRLIWFRPIELLVAVV